MRSLRDSAIDLGAMFLLLAVGVIGFGPVFGEGSGYLLAGLGGAVIGLALAFAGARFRWGVIVLTAATLVAYLVLGGAFADRASTIAGVVPTFETIRDLVLGVVISWKQLLTVSAPVTGFDTLLIVPFLSSLVAAVLAGSLALRLARRYAWALLPAVALLVVAIAFGTSNPALPLVQAVIFAAIALGWFAWRRATRRAISSRATAVAGGEEPAVARARGIRRLAFGAGILVVAVVVGAASSPLTAPAEERQVLRDTVVPPLDLRDYPSPLSSFRKYVRDADDTTLFDVTGLPKDARVRLATLDAYDGIVYNVAGDGTTGSGSFARVGSRIANSNTGTRAHLDVTIDDLAGVWLPDAGYLSSVDFTGPRARSLAAGLHYNGSTGVAIDTAGLTKGDEYGLDVVIPRTFTDEQLSSRQISQYSMPQSTNIPDIVGTEAAKMIGDAETPLEQLRAIESGLSRDGFFSHGLEGEALSRSGHGAERIAALLGADQWIGDDEQYAVTMALMATQLGMPARVVMGFYPDADAENSDSSGSSLAITGNELHAWVEVPFEGIGWVPFDPTPPKDQVPQEQQKKPRSQPKAQVLQPPPPPQEPAELPPDAPADEQPKDDDGGSFWETALAILGIAGGSILLLALLVSPMLVIGAAKTRRRRDRLNAPDPADRVSGGWDEVLDTATDLGTPVTSGGTRIEGARIIDTGYEGVGAVALARDADTSVFGPGEPTDADVEAFWGEVDRIVATMSGSVGRWQRLRARLSLRSMIARRSERARSRRSRRKAD